MHKLLSRQLKRNDISAKGSVSIPEKNWETLLSLISESYDEADKNRERIEHSLKLMSEELTERNRELRKNINALEANQVTINYQATHDVLTSLPNRKCFIERLSLATTRDKEKNQCAVLFVDLDDFKKVNDTCGHDVGDELLRIITKRLSGCLRDQDTLSRFGGDEFVAIVEGVESTEQVEEISRRFLDEVSKPCQIGRNRFFVSASIGISIYPKNSTNPDSLVRMADMAMYDAKGAGRNNYKFFNRSLERLARQQVEVEETIRRDLDEKQLQFSYIPKVSSVDKNVVGLDIRLVWPNREGRVIPRSEYFQVARKSGLIKPIQELVFSESSRQLKLWKSNSLGDFRLCMKISNSELLESNFVKDLERYFVTEAKSAHNVIVKVSESVLEDNADATLRIFEQIRAFGVEVAIDDFGKGYSSLSHLQTLPVDYLKIDRAFVDNATENSKSKAIVLSIINLAHSLGIKVLAGDVKDQKTAKILEEGGCDVLQGSYFYAPLSGDEVQSFLEKYRNK